MASPTARPPEVQAQASRATQDARQPSKLEPLFRKLAYGAALTSADEAAIERVIGPVKTLSAGANVIREGDRPEFVHLVLEGYGCHYKDLRDGRRQIMGWILPGDFCDLHVALLGEMDHGIQTLTKSKVATIDARAIVNLSQSSTTLSQALSWVTLVDEAIMRQWIVGLGRRSSECHMAHLICEVFTRLQAVGLVADATLDFAITQRAFADTLGLTPVHVNRVVQHLREVGFITWTLGKMTVHDLEGLIEFAAFNPNYLHLVKRVDR